MTDSYSREPDPLEGMLRPPALPEIETLRQTVYQRTRRVINRRRLVRRFAYAAALLVSFGVGVLATRMIAKTDVGERGRVSAPSASPGALPQPRSPSPDDSPLAREWIALESEDHRHELYRQAGDRYMTEEFDPQSALRCFSNALDNGTEQDLAISSDDNWLLMAIKDARLKEKKHAKQGG